MHLHHDDAPRTAVKTLFAMPAPAPRRRSRRCLERLRRRAGRHPSDVMSAQLARVRAGQARQLTRHRVADRVTLPRIEAVQHELVDHQFDLHIQSRTSASLGGLSILAHSVRAACSRSRIRTGSTGIGREERGIHRDVADAAAGHVQPGQLVGVQPFDRRRRRETRGARSPPAPSASGNGNSTMKRRRRRNAWSSAAR